MTGASSAAGAALAWLPAFPALVSSVALVMTAVNLGICRRARPLAEVLASRTGARPRVSVCIPARNEERNLDAAVGGALASDGVDVEVLAYDD